MYWLPLLLLFVCIAGVLHTYVCYPLYVRWAAARRCRDHSGEAFVPETWPPVHVLMAVHNEELVLEAKLESLVAQNYRGPLTFHIGDDCSSDRTPAILADFQDRYPTRFHLHPNPGRSGKPATINALAGGVPDAELFVLTDASVLLRGDTITELVRPLLRDGAIGVVDSRMVHTGLNEAGISRVEDSYISREVALKQDESRLWQRMIGPFGGCWAIRAPAFVPVPPNFLVDDFYLCMAAYEAGWLGVSCPQAVAYEGVGQHLGDEFRRKRRIGAGNWQNLLRFRHLWWPPWRDPLAFAFFSHKVLRWITPHLLLLGAACWAAVILLTGNYWVTLLFVVMTLPVCAAVLAEPALAYFGIHSTRVRALRYFAAMNLALLLGFFRFLNGINSNVWQPSHRHENDGQGRDPRQT